jgi:Zn finger protein HypA/HybF involved in hydrogenase expression
MFDQQQFRCRDCSHEVTAGHYRPTCPRCGGEIDGPLAGGDG